MLQFAQQQLADWAAEQRLSFGPGITSLQLARRGNICVLAPLPGITGEPAQAYVPMAGEFPIGPGSSSMINTVTWPEALGRNDKVDALGVASIVRAEPMVSDSGPKWDPVGSLERVFGRGSLPAYLANTEVGVQPLPPNSARACAACRSRAPPR